MPVIYGNEEKSPTFPNQCLSFVLTKGMYVYNRCVCGGRGEVGGGEGGWQWRGQAHTHIFRASSRVTIGFSIFCGGTFEGHLKV